MAKERPIATLVLHYIVPPLVLGALTLGWQTYHAVLRIEDWVNRHDAAARERTRTLVQLHEPFVPEHARCAPMHSAK